MIRVQLISIVVYALFALWHIVPRLRKLDRGQALVALLWVHVFRYVVLYLYVARKEGYPISDALLTELVIGDLFGAVLAMAGIILLRFQSILGVVFAYLVFAATIVDAIAGTYIRNIEPPRADATGVWWLVFVFFAPLIIISLPLIAWQLYSRRGEPLTAVRRLNRQAQKAPSIV